MYAGDKHPTRFFPSLPHTTTKTLTRKQGIYISMATIPGFDHQALTIISHSEAALARPKMCNCLGYFALQRMQRRVDSGLHFCLDRRLDLGGKDLEQLVVQPFVLSVCNVTQHLPNLDHSGKIVD